MGNPVSGRRGGNQLDPYSAEYLAKTIESLDKIRVDVFLCGSAGQPKYVTGFVVNERVQPRRDQRRRLRAMFHNASLHPGKFRKESAVLLGWASFVNSYDKLKGKEYIKIALKVAGVSPTHPSK